MSEQPTEQQISVALRNESPIVLAPAPGAVPRQVPPPPHQVWELPGGTAWVYYAEGHDRLRRPVIIADGFNSGPSNIDMTWEVLDWRDYAFLSQLRRRGHDVVVVGFQERSASILDNARAVTEAVLRAIAERAGDTPLTVGGFSMGGIVTRYALARMESEGDDHQTALYYSYDSPHRGAWIPLGLQAFAHYMRPLDDRFSAQINSPASRQMLVQHLENWDAEHGTDKERTEFLAELERVGGWPARPRKIGVANGVGTGQGNGVTAGANALRGKGLAITGTNLLTESREARDLVAQLRLITLRKPEVFSGEIPDIDSAPGGTLQGFGILGDALNKFTALGLGTEVNIRAHCFVPAVSAVAVRDIAARDDLYVPVNTLPEDEFELDEWKLASQNEEHTRMTEELGSWIIERLPR